MITVVGTPRSANYFSTHRLQVARLTLQLDPRWFAGKSTKNVLLPLVRGRDRYRQLSTIPDARINDVLNGGGLNSSELTRWREIVVDRAFSPGEFDREMLLWFMIEVRH